MQWVVRGHKSNAGASAPLQWLWEENTGKASPMTREGVDRRMSGGRYRPRSGSASSLL